MPRHVTPRHVMSQSHSWYLSVLKTTRHLKGKPRRVTSRQRKASSGPHHSTANHDTNSHHNILYQMKPHDTPFHNCQITAPSPHRKPHPHSPPSLLRDTAPFPLLYLVHVDKGPASVSVDTLVQKHFPLTKANTVLFLVALGHLQLPSVANIAAGRVLEKHHRVRTRPPLHADNFRRHACWSTTNRRPLHGSTGTHRRHMTVSSRKTTKTTTSRESFCGAEDVGCGEEGPSSLSPNRPLRFRRGTSQCDKSEFLDADEAVLIPPVALPKAMS